MSLFADSNSLPPFAVQQFGAVRKGVGVRMVDYLDAGSLVFSRDGKLLASVGREGIIIWDVARGVSRAKLENSGLEFKYLEFSADGRSLTLDYEYHWDTSTGKDLGRPRYGWGFSHVSGRWDLAPDGPYEAIASGQEIQLYQRGINDPLSTLRCHEAEVTAVAFSPDGRYVASGDNAGGVCVSERSNENEVDLPAPLLNRKSARKVQLSQPFSLYDPGVTAISFSPDSKKLSVGTLTQSWFSGLGGPDPRPHYQPPDIRIVDVPSMKQIVKVKNVSSGGWRPPRFSPDGQYVLAGTNGWNLIRVKDGREVLNVHSQLQSDVAAFSPDSRWLAFTGGSGGLTVYDLRTSKEHFSQPGAYRSIAFSKNMLATGGDRGIRLWDPNTGRELTPSVTESVSHMSGVVASQVSPDGHLLASAAEFGPVLVWKMATGKAAWSFKPTHGGSGKQVVFAPDGQTLVVIGSDLHLYLLDVSSGKLLLEYRDPSGGSVDAIAYSPDGLRLAYAVYGKIVVVDPGTWKITKEISRSYPGERPSIQFSRDGKLLIFERKGVELWDLNSDRPSKPWRMPDQFGYRQAMFLQDRPVLLGPLMQGICIYDLIDQKQWRCAGGLIEKEIFREAASPDGRWIVAAARDTVEALDLQQARRYKLEGHRGDITTLGFSPDSRFLISGSEDTTLLQWDLQSLASGESLEEDAIVCCEGDIESLEVSPDGKALAWGSSDLGVLDLERKERLFHTGNAAVHSVSFRRDGKKLAVAYSNGAFEIRDAATGASDLAFPKVDKDGYSIAYDPDGNSVLTSGNSIRVWNAVSAAERFSWKGYSRPAAYSPDGKWIATAEAFATIAVHSSHDGRKVISLQYPSSEQTAAVGPVLFTPDSRSVVWSSGKNLYVSDVATGGIRSALRGHEEQIRTFAVSPDGRYLASVTLNEPVIVWTVADGREVARIGHKLQSRALAFTTDGRLIVAENSMLRFWTYTISSR